MKWRRTYVYLTSNRVKAKLNEVKCTNKCIKKYKYSYKEEKRKRIQIIFEEVSNLERPLF